MALFFPLYRLVRSIILLTGLLGFFAAKSQSAKTIGIIDVYGLKDITENKVREMIGIREGDSLSPSFTTITITDRVKKIPGVRNAVIANVCCDPQSNGVILFIGVAEKEEVRIRYNPTPTGQIRLPDEINITCDSFMTYMTEGIMKGEANEDRTMWYSLMQYPPARKQQEKFLAYAAKYQSLITNVLHNAADADQRANAAAVIAYGSDKKIIINELMQSIHDHDDEVRNNATRALALIAGYAQKNLAEGLKISPIPFIEMTRSLVWTDRNKGMAVLTALTESRDKNLLTLLKNECLAELIEMAKWKSNGHAAFSLLVLSRIAGKTDAEAFDQMEKPGKNQYVDELVRMIGN